MSEYETWCHACSVSFPVGTKKCLHCGGRVRPERPRASMRRREAAEVDLLAASPLSYSDEVDSLTARPDQPVSDAPLEPEEEPARRSLLRGGMTVIWMILLAAGYAWRACSPA